MAHGNVNNSTQGFYVFQAAVGAPLEFHPALGTPELDELVDNYVPGFSPIQDKRATVSLDFLENLGLTGETVKFYPSTLFSATSATSSPASLQDSGYASSFTASPMASTWSWGQVSLAPSASQSQRQSTVRSRTSDLSHLPGMKILTKDGRDVTNAASRGCKTKEQRDHAHLMRIIKACESCRRKKIRCDPSHKTREAVKTRDSRPNSRPVARRPQGEGTSPTASGVPHAFFSPPSLAPTTPFAELSSMDPAQFDAVCMEGWEDLLNLDRNIPNIPLSPPVVPDDYDYVNDPMGLFSPSPLFSSDSVYSRASWPSTSPSTSVPQSVSTSPGDGVLPSEGESAERLPTLPYLDENVLPHNYVDFTLYSPTSSLADHDEVPAFSGHLFRSPSGEEMQSLPTAGGATVASSTHHSPRRSVVSQSPSPTSSGPGISASTESVSATQPRRAVRSSPLPSSVAQDSDRRPGDIHAAHAAAAEAGHHTPHGPGASTTTTTSAIGLRATASSAHFRLNRSVVASVNLGLERESCSSGVGHDDILALLQVVVMMMTIFRLGGERSRLTIASHTLVISLVSALVVGVLLHAISAPSLGWTDMLRSKGSFHGVVLCAFALATSQPAGKMTAGKSEDVGPVPTQTRGKQDGRKVTGVRKGA